ncbi:MAG: bifunctional (p)ppGpp synthetase/guanosine-3',5'-bis(diphosphate) 3'-pyrophosphohydrolase, partial [Hyphomicrobiaceae bacterium]
YAVHTDIGNSCVGCKINGRHQSLLTQLRNGDEVEIIRSNAQSPPPAWENVVRTGKARSAIRRASREAVRRQFSELGRRLLSSAFDKVGQAYSEEGMKKGLARLSQKSVEEALTAVGRGELGTDVVTRAVYPEIVPPQPVKPDRRRRNRFDKGAEEGWFNLRGKLGLKFYWPGKAQPGETVAASAPTIALRGLQDNLPVEYAEGGALPGDRIVGILIPGKAIRIYQIHSPALKEFDDQPDRWIDVRWDIAETSTERFPARIKVQARNEPGSLAQIAQAIADADGNIDNIRMLERGAELTDMLIEIEVWDLMHLNQVIAALKSRPVVSKVDRVFH